MVVSIGSTMSINNFERKEKLWSRRQLLKLGTVGVGVTGVAAAWQVFNGFKNSKVKIPPIEQGINSDIISPMKVLRDFDYGVIKKENGRTIREFRITAGTSTLQLNSAVAFNSWNFNNRVPGPTLRAKEGDRVRILFFNQGGHAHSMHFHGNHISEMDGVRPIRNGKATVYEFDAEPFGVHLYHCHIEPVTRHIGKGLYGMFIIDPPNPRPPADEMVLIMGGYDVNEDQKNELYAFNGMPDYYMNNPIKIYQNQLVRAYVLNLIEFDPSVAFHLHANFFQVYPTGRTLKPSQEADVITMGTAERHILEFAYPHSGKYMFHPHQDWIAEHGCMGQFEVIPSDKA